MASDKEIEIQYEIKTIDCVYTIVRYTDGTRDIIETMITAP